MQFMQFLAVHAVSCSSCSSCSFLQFMQFMQFLQFMQFMQFMQFLAVLAVLKYAFMLYFIRRKILSKKHYFTSFSTTIVNFRKYHRSVIIFQANPLDGRN